MKMRVGLVLSVLMLVGALLPAIAAAQGRGGAEPRPFYDSRAGAAPSAPAAKAPGRAALRADLGRSGVLALNPLTNTPRALLKTSGALTGPSAGSRDGIARRYLRDNASALGLSGGDVAALTLAKRIAAPGGVTILRYRQAYRGIPAFDNGVRVALDRAGRVLGVTGSPQPSLAVDSITPKLSAAAATRALQRSVGRRATGKVETARLTLFGAKGGPRLAWRVTFRASSIEHYVGVVDAISGRLLWRANRVKSYSAKVFEYYAGAPDGGDPEHVVDLSTPGWLAPTRADPERPVRARVVGPRRRQRRRRRRGGRAVRRRLPVRLRALRQRRAALHADAPLLVGPGRRPHELGDQPRADRDAGLLPGQQVPRPPRARADRLHRHHRCVRGRRPGADPVARRRRPGSRRSR